MNQQCSDVYGFKNELKVLFKRYAPQLADKIEQLNSFIFEERRFNAYKYMPVENSEEDNYGSKIWVLTNSGLLKDFAEVSSIFRARNDINKWSTYKYYIYYNEELLKKELEDPENAKPINSENKEKLIREIRQLIENTNLRSHIEIEEKYSCTKPDINTLKRELENPCTAFGGKYKIDKNNQYPVEQCDVYYDTENMLLANSNCSLRCRIKGTRYIFTIKKPTPVGSFDQESQFARFEYKMETDANDLSVVFDFISSNLREVFAEDGIVITKGNIGEILTNKLMVNNQRFKYYVSDGVGEGTFQFSVCLDQVLFEHNDQTREDYQIEVELESDYIHRVSMKFFTKEIEKLLKNGYEHEKDSKYIKGLKVFDLI